MNLSQTDENILQSLADELIKEVLPQAITDAESQLPAFYSGLISLVVMPLEASLQAKLQAWVDAKLQSMVVTVAPV